MHRRAAALYHGHRYSRVAQGRCRGSRAGLEGRRCARGVVRVLLGWLFGVVDSSFAAGWESPRNVFVELSGGINFVFACLYLVAYARKLREASVPAVVPFVAKRYDLTKREEEMLEMLVEGLSNQQISSQAYISVGNGENARAQHLREIGH